MLVKSPCGHRSPFETRSSVTREAEPLPVLPDPCLSQPKAIRLTTTVVRDFVDHYRRQDSGVANHCDVWLQEPLSVPPQGAVRVSFDVLVPVENAAPEGCPPQLRMHQRTQGLCSAAAKCFRTLSCSLQHVVRVRHQRTVVPGSR
jgi:hypothetical protein